MNKPSEPEEEYFAHENAERLRKLSAEQLRGVSEAERRQLRDLHRDRCSNCGMGLHSVVFRETKLMRCFDCGSIFLGPGEMEKLAGAEKEKGTGLMNDVLRIFEHKHSL